MTETGSGSGGGQGAGGRRLPLREGLLFLSVLALCLYAPIASWRAEGLTAAFKYFAVDAFYYLGVAQRSVGAPFFTNDALHATNGFHPLWQYALTAAFGGLDIAADQPAQIRFSFFVSVALTSLGFAFFSLVMLRLSGSFALALLGAVPGPYYFLTRIPGMGLHYGAPWSYMNGMESPLSTALFGAGFFALTRAGFFERAPSLVRLLAASTFLALLTLTRLDDVFIFVPMLGYAAITADRPTPRAVLPRVAAAAMPPAILIGAYMIYNMKTVGAAMPISGASKTSFALPGNLSVIAGSVAPFAFSGGRPADFVDNTFRACQMLLPPLVTLAFLVPFAARVRAEARNAPPEAPFPVVPPTDALLCFLSIYTVVKSLYNLTNITTLHQGHWYYPLTMMTMNLLVVTAAGRFKSPGFGARGARGTAASAGAFALALFLAVGFAGLKRTDDYQIPLWQVWSRGAETRAAFDERTGARGLLELDDGLISYAMNLPAIGGLGFTLDREAFEAKEAGELLDLAHARGFNVLATFQYPPPINREMFRDPDALREQMRRYDRIGSADGFVRPDVDLWDFKILFVEQRPFTLFVEFEPRVPKAQ